MAEAPSGGESPHTLPMRDSGFELGLNAYWQPWNCTQIVMPMLGDLLIERVSD